MHKSPRNIGDIENFCMKDVENKWEIQHFVEIIQLDPPKQRQ